MDFLRKIILILLLLVPVATAHGDVSVWDRLGIIDPLAVVLWASVISGLFIFFSLHHQKRMGGHAKKIAFLLIIMPVAAATLYLGGSTLYLNLASATGGPVHWHADYEVWACGEKYELMAPEGLENRVGTPTVHEHGDNRMHIEGVLLDKSEASLHEFFESTGGEFTGDSLRIITDEGMKGWTNGDLCNGKPARWHVFVNGKLSEEADMYIIAPYPDVPPGDRIKIVFSEKPPDKINPDLFEVP